MRGVVSRTASPHRQGDARAPSSHADPKREGLLAKSIQMVAIGVSQPRDVWPTSASVRSFRNSFAALRSRILIGCVRNHRAVCVRYGRRDRRMRYILPRARDVFGCDLPSPGRFCGLFGKAGSVVSGEWGGVDAMPAGTPAALSRSRVAN